MYNSPRDALEGFVPLNDHQRHAKEYLSAAIGMYEAMKEGVGIRIAALEADNEKLTAIVDRLPKTADGVPVVPGMEVWLRTRTTPMQNTVRDVGKGYIELREDPKGCYLNKWYSTREAAEEGGE